jgi:hypothetical protein
VTSPHPRLIQQALIDKAVVATKHTLTDESLLGLLQLQEGSPYGSEGPVEEWLNSPLPEQAGRQKNGLDELQRGLTNLLGFFRLSPGSQEGAMLWSPVASRFGPDSPPGSSSQSPRLLSPVQQGARHSPTMNAAALHHSASTEVRLPS